MKKSLAVAIIALAGAQLSAHAFAAGPGGHIPTVNPGTGPSGRTLPAMPMPAYGGGSGVPRTTPVRPPRPTGLPAAGVTGTPAMTVGRPNSKATSRFPR